MKGRERSVAAALAAGLVLACAVVALAVRGGRSGGAALRPRDGGAEREAAVAARLARAESSRRSVEAVAAVEAPADDDGARASLHHGVILGAFEYLACERCNPRGLRPDAEALATLIRALDELRVRMKDIEGEELAVRREGLAREAELAIAQAPARAEPRDDPGAATRAALLEQQRVRVDAAHGSLVRLEERRGALLDEASAALEAALAE